MKSRPFLGCQQKGSRRRKLDELSTPAKDGPLATLKASVARAELEARKARADVIVSDPTRSLVEISVAT